MKKLPKKKIMYGLFGVDVIILIVVALLELNTVGQQVQLPVRDDSTELEITEISSTEESIEINSETELSEKTDDEEKHDLEHFDRKKWVPYWCEELEDENGETYLRLVQRDIPVSGRGFDSIHVYQFDNIASEVFKMSGDLSFETQVAVASVIFNRVDSPLYSDSIDEVLEKLYGGKYVPAMRCAFGYSGSNAAEVYPDEWDSVCEAVQSVINDEDNIPDVPRDVTMFSTHIIPNKEGDLWEADCVEGIYFYYE